MPTENQVHNLIVALIDMLEPTVYTDHYDLVVKSLSLLEYTPNQIQQYLRGEIILDSELE